MHQLWDDLLLFREPSRAIWVARNPNTAAATGELGIPSGPCLDGEDATPSAILLDRLQKRQHSQHEHLASQDELDRMLHFQLEHLQAFGCRVPEEMTEQLRTMTEHATTVSPDVHFVKCAMPSSAL